MPKKIAILGLGWLGLPLANSLLSQGYEITGSTTSSEKLMRLLQSQLAVKIIKVNSQGILGNWKKFIEGCSLLIINIPPPPQSNMPTSYSDYIEQIINRCDPQLKVIFISSTSVYGNHNQLATEENPPQPTLKNGHELLNAENKVRNHFGNNATILRLAGLFGSGRHPGRFLTNKAAVSNPEAVVNLIHLNDCIKLISAVIGKNCFGEIINGCADAHPTRRDFYTKAARALNTELPVFEANQPTQGKTVCNEKSKQMLGVEYLNPLDFLSL